MPNSEIKFISKENNVWPPFIFNTPKNEKKGLEPFLTVQLLESLKCIHVFMILLKDLWFLDDNS